jgi:hypothetical protein
LEEQDDDAGKIVTITFALLQAALTGIMGSDERKS